MKTPGAALRRYWFYYDRYMNQKRSLNIESKLHVLMKRMTKDAQARANPLPGMNYRYIKDAVEVLSKCRQTLMFTYIFTYYLENDTHATIFELNQTDLELAVEDLSECLQWKINVGTVLDMKLAVQGKYRYCESRRKTLVDHVKEGDEENIWKYRDG